MKKIGYLLSFGLMFTLLECGTSVATKETPEPALSMKVTASMRTQKNQPDMSMAEFNQIKNGMTYEQVTAIVGSPGVMVAEAGTPGDQFYTVSYQFKGEGSWFSGAFAQLMFQSGKLNTKAQMGLVEIKN